MTVGQQESLFAWLDKFKGSELAKVTKANMTDILGIPVAGCIVNNGEAWGGGTFTLGFSRATGTVVLIVHLGRWDWTEGSSSRRIESCRAPRKASSRA